MKRMVKNGDLLDISEDGSGVTFGGNLKVGGTIIANGEIRGGDVSASKFYLGTEEMPLVKANPAGDATGTLEKIKIGNVSYNVGGGGSNDRELTLIMPYDSSDSSSDKKLIIDDEIWANINNCYYETIKIFYNDGNPIGVFNVFNFTDTGNYISNNKNYTCISVKKDIPPSSQTWYGVSNTIYTFVAIGTYSSGTKKYLYLYQYNFFSVPNLVQSKFDALYKLADKPTGDGTYVLKATVSGGAVTYTWVAQ